MRSVGSFAKVALKAALATQSGKITRSRPGKYKPACPDLAVLDDFGALQHKSALTSAQFSVKPLQAVVPPEWGQQMAAGGCRMTGRKGEHYDSAE